MNVEKIDGIEESKYEDKVAEWLRRWTAYPLGSACVSSNLILVGIFFLKDKSSNFPFNGLCVGQLLQVKE